MSVTTYYITDEYLYPKAPTLNSITLWVQVFIYNFRKLREVVKVLLVSVAFSP